MDGLYFMLLTLKTFRAAEKCVKSQFSYEFSQPASPPRTTSMEITGGFTQTGELKVVLI